MASAVLGVPISESDFETSSELHRRTHGYETFGICVLLFASLEACKNMNSGKDLLWEPLTRSDHGKTRVTKRLVFVQLHIVIEPGS